MDAYEIPESIQWHEGLLLTPQHFQQLALRQEALLQYVSAAISPFNWGVRYFKVDPAGLAGGTFRVLELEAVMPDSLVVSVGLRRGEELQIELAPYAEQIKQRPATVYLAVPARETDALRRGDVARYNSVEGDPVADENTGEGNVRIPRLRPRLSLIVADTLPKKYVGFPLARVEYRGESFGLTEFIPPALVVERRSALGVMCSNAARRLREKAMFLADQLRVPASGARAGLDRDTEALIRALVAPLPALEAVLATGVTHPYTVYLALCNVAGSVAGIGRSLVPPAFAPYNHDDPRASFEQVIAFIGDKVDEGVTASFTGYPFRFDEGAYSLMFDPAWTGKRLVVAVRGSAGMTEQEVLAWGREALIGSRSRIPAMRQHRVLGARRDIIDRDEDLVPPRGGALFSLKPDPDFVIGDEDLQILNASGRAQRPSEVVLYVKNSA